MGSKRNYDSAMGDAASTMESRPSPFLPMFESFRAELDEHHDRRERIVKASRDITAASKKIIFALQRVRTLGKPLPPPITKSIAAFQTDTIAPLFARIAPDLQSINAHRYARAVSPGLQEYTEAALFEHYLATQQLLPYDATAARVARLVATSATHDALAGGHDLLTPEDYLLGAYDATGELMRFAITAMATAGGLPSSLSATSAAAEGGAPDVGVHEGKPGGARTVLQDLQTLRQHLETLDTSGADFYFAKAARQKGEVMRASVDKVERALYGLVVRGSERPKGWVPPADDYEQPREVEDY